jgi:excisionase family DNA binding protein
MSITRRISIVFGPAGRHHAEEKDSGDSFAAPIHRSGIAVRSEDEGRKDVICDSQALFCKGLPDANGFMASDKEQGGNSHRPAGKKTIGQRNDNLVGTQRYKSPEGTIHLWIYDDWKQINLGFTDSPRVSMSSFTKGEHPVPNTNARSEAPRHDWTLTSRAERPASSQGDLGFERLLNAVEAAGLLRIHPKTLQRLTRLGQIPAFRVGRFWRYR